MATGTDPEKKAGGKAHSEEEDQTQLIPQVQGKKRVPESTIPDPKPEAKPEPKDEREGTPKGWAGATADTAPARNVQTPPRVEPEAAAEGEVPQETVPMPAVQWPPSPSASAEPEESAKPPSLRRKRADAPTDPHKRIEVSPRPGLLTSELRRALPPWALPLLTFQPFSVWLGARIGLTLLAILATLMIPSIPAQGTADWYGAPGGPTLNPIVDSIAGVWTRWDGQWYLKIATEGYSATDGTTAFFPLYPWIVSVVGWLAGERYIWTGILLSSLFFLAALVLLHRLVRLDFSPKDASRTVFYVAAFPMSFFFWAVYSESLFLLLVVGTFLAARTGHWWWAGLTAAFAIWTRATGVLLVLPIIWEMVRAFRPPAPAPNADPTTMPPRRPSPVILASLALPALGVAGLMGWSALQFGNATAFVSSQGDWLRRFAWPWETLVRAFGEAARMPYSYQVENQNWTYLGFFIFALVCGALALRWLRGSYSVFLLSGILVPLFTPASAVPLLSFPRFLIVLFPIYMVMALAGRNRYIHQIITWLSFLLLALFTIRFVNWYWVA
jgi:hypothetical protein